VAHPSPVRLSRRKLPVIAVTLAAAGLPTALALPSLAGDAPRPARVVSVTSVAALQRAAAAAAPGDRIELADGSYSTSGTIQLTRSGSATAPITIAAAHVGKAEIKGAAGFGFGAIANVTVEGFRFTHRGVVSIPVAANHIRLSRNVFQLSGGLNWVTVAGNDCEVDHNTFQNKSTEGVFLQIAGPGDHDMAKRTWIHHNYFFNHTFGGSNGGESIRLGLSSRQHGMAFAVVEYNLFERANGDSEAISVKSSDNVIRFNTLRNSRGQITLRHGWRNLVEGNILIGGSTGIRFYGNDHVIINNVVQNTGGQAIEVGGGEIRDDTANTKAHEAADRCLVAFNTLVGNRVPAIQVGGGKRFAPDSITLADNIVVGTGSGSAARVSQGTHLIWQGNIAWRATGGTGWRVVNPALVADSGGLFRLTASSPAINAALGTYPQATRDLDLQTRSGAKDVGADEFVSGDAPRKPLLPADVGPLAA
jgi:poly(beta-D-mannuronate) lyase